MPKLAIYVPKKDMREIEKWRKKINFSKVFMRALFQEITERSRDFEAPKDKLTTAARHYKDKLVESSESLVEFGYRLGSKHVLDCRLVPDTIMQLLDVGEADSLTSENIVAIEKTMGQDLKSAEAFSQEQGCDERSHPTWRNAICEGYLKGVAAAWTRVCEQMRAM